MTSTKQHDLKRSKGPQKATATTSKAADTGSAARTPPRERPQSHLEKQLEQQPENPKR